MAHSVLAPSPMSPPSQVSCGCLSPSRCDAYVTELSIAFIDTVGMAYSMSSPNRRLAPQSDASKVHWLTAMFDAWSHLEWTKGKASKGFLKHPKRPSTGEKKMYLVGHPQLGMRSK